MANQLTFAQVLSAGHVRLAELGRLLVEQLARYDADYPAVERTVDALLHLRFGLEAAAQVAKDSADQQAILAYLIETYALGVALTDPFLRPLLPPIDADGATVRYRVLAANKTTAFVLPNGRLLVVGASLGPSV